jgi:ribosomal protein S12 methylthiotransferase
VRYYLDLFGCAKNQVDAETLMLCLDRLGWTRAESPETAEAIIVHSCGFIETAKQESINAVLEHRAAYPDKKLVLAGCLSQRYPRELAESLPEADVIFGNRDFLKLAEAISSSVPGFKDPSEFVGKRPLLSMPGSAYVKISEGCDNRCTFCAIPRIRGRLVCREVDDIVQECWELLDRGLWELCLIGQDLASYRAGSAGLPELLEALSRLPGRFWVRLLYLHPDNIPLGLLEGLQKDSRFLPYFDLPFQHASARILRAMNRRGNAEAYLVLLDRIRTALPDAVIRSTFLLGFPGETDADFQILLDFQAEAHLDWMGCFTYSREEQTPAYRMKPPVPKPIAERRRNIIEERQTPLSEKQAERFIGRTLDALVEEKIAEGLYLGRLFCHAPEVDGSAVIRAAGPIRIGSAVPVEVSGRSGFDLEAFVKV